MRRNRRTGGRWRSPPGTMEAVVPKKHVGEAEWSVFVVERAGWARSLARGLLGGEAEVDDAVQEAWGALHRALSGWRAEAPFPAWARRVVRNALIDFGRRRGR